ncbi:hypothetical protein [Streptomyces sp. S1]|uniref:hypothetical protein n=1 Tax=Streptomyces sp. S1 TaxID=718288 RepID=UPI003D7394C2
MSDIEKAARDAVDAQANAEQVAMVLAILQAQQLTPQPPAQAPAPVQQQQSPAKWVAVGVAAPFLAVSLAVGFVAVAVSAVAVTICVLVLRGLWVDMQKDRKR